MGLIKLAIYALEMGCILFFAIIGNIPMTIAISTIFLASVIMAERPVLNEIKIECMENVDNKIN